MGECEVVAHHDQLLLALVANEASAQRFGVQVDVGREALRDREPDRVARRCGWRSVHIRRDAT